jgi:hypothetical protein
LKKAKTTGFSKQGVLAIDDTGSLKPYAKKNRWRCLSILSFFKR